MSPLLRAVSCAALAVLAACHPSTDGPLTGDTGTHVTDPVGELPEACRLPNVLGGPVDLGFPRHPERLPTTGTVVVTVLFGTYTDVTPQRTPAELLAVLSPGAEDLFHAMSYGQLDVVLEPHLQWLQLSGPSADYGAAIRTFDGHRDFLREGIAQADDVVDFSNTDLVLLVGPPSATGVPYGPAFVGFDAPAGRLEADGNVILNGVTSGADLLGWGSPWLNHEMGHTLGLPDLYSFAEPLGFTRPFSLMDLISGAAPELLAYERWHLGWIDDAQVLCDVFDQSVRLTPVEDAGGVKMAVVRIDDTTALVVESRRARGADVALPVEGVVVYVVDTSVASGGGPIRVVSGEVPLGPGASVEERGVTVEVVSSGRAGDVIRVGEGPR